MSIHDIDIVVLEYSILNRRIIYVPGDQCVKDALGRSHLWLAGSIVKGPGSQAAR